VWSLVTHEEVEPFMIVLEILGVWLLLAVLTVAALNGVKALVRRHS